MQSMTTFSKTPGKLQNGECDGSNLQMTVWQKGSGVGTTFLVGYIKFNNCMCDWYALYYTIEFI